MHCGFNCVVFSGSRRRRGEAVSRLRGSPLTRPSVSGKTSTSVYVREYPNTQVRAPTASTGARCRPAG